MVIKAIVKGNFVLNNLNNFFAIVVLYNKRIDESLTLECLKDMQDIRIIVCDNSTKNYHNESLARKLNFSYINMGGNRGLSCAYNKAISFLKSEAGYVCLFDDDTKVTKEYFEKLKLAVKEEKKDIYLPFLYDSIGILSPCKIKGVFVKRFKDKKNINKKNITGINSAMAINLDIFKEGYRYNESYFLDYIDHDFVRTIKKKNKKIGILDVNLFQNFSGSSSLSKDSSLKRFKIFKKDFKLFCSENFLSRICSFFVIIKRLVRLSVQFRTLDFLLKD